MGRVEKKTRKTGRPTAIGALRHEAAFKIGARRRGNTVSSDSLTNGSEWREISSGPRGVSATWLATIARSPIWMPTPRLVESLTIKDFMVDFQFPI